MKRDLDESTFTTKEYGYEGQRLWRYNGEYIEYNGSDTRPYFYRDKMVEWAKGGQLASYNGHTFTYDTQGRRLTKDNITFTYDSQGRVVKQSNGLEFFYDHTGVVAVKYNGNMYFYRKDVQGNIVAIVDSSGWLMVEYEYDAWGRNTYIDESTMNLGMLNPFRYRGYYYDEETGLYFLKTRYYDPEIGRFISIDGIEYLDPETVNGLNLYAYCNNNPVMNIDPNGTWSWKKFWSVIGAVAVVAAAVVVSVVTWGTAAPVLIGMGVAAAAYTAGQVYEYAMTGSFEWSWGGFAGAIAGGALAGLVSVSSLGKITGLGDFIAGALINAGTMIGENIAGDAKHSILGIMVTSVFAGGISAASAGVMNKIKIPGLTAGRGSISSISKQITTKFQKHLIQRISVKTFSKMFAYESYNGIFGDWINAGLDALGWKGWLLKFIP